MTEVSEVREQELSGGQIWGVVDTYNRPESLGVVVDSVRSQTRPVDHLLIVDNGGDPDLPARCRGWGAEYIDASDNLGAAGGIALGMEYVLENCADKDWMVLVEDDDPAWDPDLLRRLAQLSQTLVDDGQHVACVGLVGSRCDRRRGRFLRLDDDELHGPAPVDYIGGNQFPMYRVVAVRSVGVLDRCPLVPGPSARKKEV